jgi:prepilin-type N-terminal cleavage/methylation domain-containing protein
MDPNGTGRMTAQGASRPRPGSHPGFTLIELLIVIAVIGILVGILFPIAGAAFRHMQRTRVRALVEQLSPVCEQFQMAHGQYPWARPAAVTGATAIRAEEVYAELRAAPGSTINTTHDYLSGLPAKFIRSVGGKDRLVDAWGGDIAFRVNPNGGAPVIWSCGRDGKDDTNDGVSPDPAKFPKTYYWFGTGKKSDDIANR